jgi:hypothetical protein
MTFKVCIALFLLSSATAYSQISPYFPRIGPKAATEEIRELQNPSVILVIAMAPGSEDLASLAYSRIGRGSAVSVAFVTNGEDVPSDFSGETFYRLAARRKEEAYKALSYLGVQPYFLNIPIDLFSAGEVPIKLDPGVSRVMTVRLDSVIDHVRPDVIVLDRDPLYGGRVSPRMRDLEKIVLANLLDRERSDKWRVTRVFLESAGREDAIKIPVDRVDPLWSQSYSLMADKAEEYYPSLKFHIRLWNRDRPHRYMMIFPRAVKPPKSLTQGLPGFGKEIGTLFPYIRPVFSLSSQAGVQKRAKVLENAIARVDAFIATQQNTADRAELRIVDTWKFGLERLRCTILGVDLNYTVSDSVLAQLQLFFLRIGKIQSHVGNKGLQILFPGVVDKQWIVNEEQSEFYRLHENDTFRVITPKSIRLTSPESPEGFESLRMRAPFWFIVVHHDKNPYYNFMYRAEVPLIIAPIRSIQVLTPQVAAFRDSIVRVRLKSNSRDSAKGKIYVDDPLVHSSPVSVDLRGKNYVQIDTLHLSWKDTVLTGIRRVELFARKGEGVGAFFAHYLRVKSEPRGRVAFYSTIENSPLQSALGRLRVVATDLEKIPGWVDKVATYSTIIVDQFSYDAFLKSAGQPGDLGRWISGGGRLIVLPQYGIDMKSLDPQTEAKFTYLPITGSRGKLVIDSSSTLFKSSNELREGSFSAGQFPISFGSVSGTGASESKVLITAGENLPQLIEQTAGNGRIIYCALNLSPRFLALDDTAYELLANLLSH